MPRLFFEANEGLWKGEPFNLQNADKLRALVKSKERTVFDEVAENMIKLTD
jgi:hypothetical protein